MHHLPDVGAGPDDGDLHDEITEACGTVPWQRRHLRAALHLEHTYGVSLLQDFVDIPQKFATAATPNFDRE